MTTEELKIKLTVDQSALKQSVNQAKKTISGLNDSVGKGAAAGVNETTASVDDLKESMEQVRNLNFAGLLAKAFDSSSVKNSIKNMKKHLKDVGDYIKDAGISLQIGFDSKHWKDLDYDTKGFKNNWANIKWGIQDASESISLATKSIGKAFRSMGQAIGAVLDSTMVKLAAFAAAVLGTVAAIRNALSTAQNIKHLNAEAEKIGLSVNAYREWGYVLEQVGVEASELTGLIKGLTDQQKEVRNGSEDVTRAFNELGLAAGDVINMGQEQLFTETVKRLQNVTNEVERTSLAYQIFGEDAAHLANVLRLTNNETNSLRAQVTLLGASVSQGLLDKSIALANAVSNLRLAWQGLTNTLAELLMPVIQKVVEWLTKAIVVVNLFLKTVFGLDMTPAISNVGAAVGGLGDYTDSVEEATGAVEKLKRTTMGFDELNIVNNPNSSGGGASAGAGGGGGIDLGGALDTDNSIFTKAQEQIEAFQEKVRAFMKEWEDEIKIIGIALAALGIAGLLSQFGQLLGLGDGFLTMMNTIKKLATSAIVITLQYSLVNEFLDNYIDGEGFKEWIKAAIVAALGSAVLYAMWGPAGLAIGLGVTAVASFKALWDNGGITNMESFVVALTGIATAFGAIKIAWSKLGLAKLVGDLGAFIALLKEGNSISAVLAAAFPKAAGALGSVSGGLAALGGGSVAAGLAIVAAAIAAVVAVIIFLKENWDAVVKAFRDFFEINIAPKIEDMKKSFERMKEALGPVGEAIANVVKAIGDWFKSVDWIEGIGKVFEVVGGIIFGVVSGVISGALNMFVSIIEGFIQAVSGIVDIVSGVVKAVVKLFSGDLKGAWEAVKQIGEGIVNVFVGLYDATIGAVVEFVKGVISWFVELWDELVGHSIVPDMVNAIVKWFTDMPGRVLNAIKKFVKDVINAFKDMWNSIKNWFAANVAPKFTSEYWRVKFETIRSAAATKLGEVKNAITGKWNEVKSWFSSNVAPKFTAGYWQGKFDTIRAAASTKMAALKDTFTNGWNTIKNWFNSAIKPKFTAQFWTNKFSSIKDGAKNVFNSIINVVETAINSIIRKLNTISFSIPSWVPKIGGNKFGISLREVKIPRLATGGIAVNSTLANIGENGREAILPLDNNTSWMDTLVNKINSRNSGPFILKVGEREIALAVVDGINSITKETGDNPLLA